MTTFQHATVRGLRIFYREAGSKASPNHRSAPWLPKFLAYVPRPGPAASGQILRDCSGFRWLWLQRCPDAGKFDYTFDNLASHIEELLFGVLGLKKFSTDVQDYGAPVGYRIASKHLNAIEGIVVQNGIAYVEGIGEAFDPMKPFWANRNPGTEKPVRDLLKK